MNATEGLEDEKPGVFNEVLQAGHQEEVVHQDLEEEKNQPHLPDSPRDPFLTHIPPATESKQNKRESSIPSCNDHSITQSAVLLFFFGKRQSETTMRNWRRQVCQMTHRTGRETVGFNCRKSQVTKTES